MKSSIKYLVVFFGLMLIAPLTSHAACSYERQAELSRIASNIQLSYSYDFKHETGQDAVVFTINMTNITNDIYVKDDYGKTFNTPEASANYQTGMISFDIYSADAACPNEKIVTKYITLPKYNPLASTEQCKKYPNFKLCGMWANIDKEDSLTFDKQFNDYQKMLEANKAQAEKEKTTLEEIGQFLTENKYLIGVVLISVILIFVLKRKISRRS